MSTFKRLSAFLFFIIALEMFVGCSATKKDAITFVEDPPFKIEHAYFQNWLAGIPEGGSGTNINVSFSEIQDDVQIEYFYFTDKVIKPIATPQYRDQYTEPGLQYRGYYRNDIKQDIIMSSNPIDEANNLMRQKPPFELEKDQLVIGYRFEGKKTIHYYKLPFISERPMTAYPQNNPNGIE